MVDCPECGRSDIESEVENVEDGYVLDDIGVHKIVRCPSCGRKFHLQYGYRGVYDPSLGEYIWEDR